MVTKSHERAGISMSATSHTPIPFAWIGQDGKPKADWICSGCTPLSQDVVILYPCPVVEPELPSD